MKKTVALLVALMLLCCCSLAFAANSKGSGTGIVLPTSTEPSRNSSGSGRNTASVLAPAIVLFDAPEGLVSDFAAANPVITMFDEDTQNALAGLVEDTASVDLIDLNNITVVNYTEGYGAVSGILDFDTDYSQFNTVVAVIVANGQETIYEMTPDTNGNLPIALEAEIIEDILADSTSFIAVLAK